MMKSVHQELIILNSPKYMKTEVHTEGPKPATRGGEWEPIKISPEIQPVGQFPEYHHKPSTQGMRIAMD